MAPLIFDGDQLLKSRIFSGTQNHRRDLHAARNMKQLHLHDNTSALVSANPNYAPIIDEEMVIIGRVIKV